MGDAHLFMFIFDVAFVIYVIGSLAHMKAQLARDRAADQVFFTQTLPQLLTDTITAATRPLADSNERIAQMVRDLHPR